MLLGCIGKDNYGSMITSELQKVNVKPILEIREDLKSSRCGVGICKKERCLVPQIIASTMLSMDFVEANMSEIDKNQIIFIEGYFIIEKYDIVKSLAAKFNLANKKVAFTLSATFIIDNFYDKVVEISNSSDLIFCNEDEARSFAKVDSSVSIEKAGEIIHKLLTPKDRTIIVTCGCDPVVITQMKNGEYSTIAVPVGKISSEEIVDTNGCGDCKFFFFFLFKF